MTIDEFIDKLEADGGWEITSCKGIRRKDHPQGGSFGYCPIEYLGGCWGALTRAGPKLGLSDSASGVIIEAADASFNYLRPLRARLLKACGLEEAA